MTLSFNSTLKPFIFIPDDIEIVAMHISGGSISGIGYTFLEIIFNKPVPQIVEQIEKVQPRAEVTIDGTRVSISIDEEPIYIYK